MSFIKVVDSTWLQQHLDDHGLVVLDARSPADYAREHIFHARWIDVGQLALASTAADALEQFSNKLAAVFSASGIAPQNQVVVYSKGSDAAAARVAWALRYAGHPLVAILDGGLDQALDLPRTSQASVFTTTRFVVRPIASLVTTASSILADLAAPQRTLLDLRDAADYAGEQSGARRRGHIPGAIHWDVRHELDDAGRLAAPAELAARLGAEGIRPEHEVVLYCGSGGRASRSLVAFQHAGYRNVSVYPPSWSEWGNRDDLPIELAHGPAA